MSISQSEIAAKAANGPLVDDTLEQLAGLLHLRLKLVGVYVGKYDGISSIRSVSGKLDLTKTEAAMILERYHLVKNDKERADIPVDEQDLPGYTAVGESGTTTTAETEAAADLDDLVSYVESEGIASGGDTEAGIDTRSGEIETRDRSGAVPDDEFVSVGVERESLVKQMLKRLPVVKSLL
jgi:hypothetical protein